MEAKLTLLSIPLLGLHKVISYLSTREVYFILAKVCRKLREITENSKEIPLNLIREVVGASDETIRVLKGFELSTLLSLLKSIYVDSIELPYHGIRTDGGCDDHDARYFMDRIFQARYGAAFDAFSSRPGDEFHVEGALALDYFDSKKLFKKLAVNDGVNDKLLEKYRQYEEKEKTDIQAELTKAALSDNKNNVEISYFPLEETNSVITSIEVKRHDLFRCPTKTVALFCSDERIDFSDPLLKAFSGTKSIIELEALYESSAAKLPQIEATNVLSLKKYARQKAYEPTVEPTGTAEVVLFSNNTKSKVKIVAWLRIGPATQSTVKVHLKQKNYFSGKYVVGKLLDRDEKGYYEQNKNHDLKSISLKGTLLTRNKVLLNTLRYHAEMVLHVDNLKRKNLIM